MKKLFFLIIIIMFAVHSGIVYPQNKLGYNGLDTNLLSIGYAAQSLALAEANIAQNNNPFAGFYNPAGLSDIKDTHLYSLHGQLSDETEIFSLNLAAPVSDAFVLNIAWIQMQILNIDLISTTNADLNTDLEKESLTLSLSNGIIAACAAKLSDNLAFGLSGSFYQQTFSGLTDKAYGFSLTPGLCYQLNKDFNFGVSLKNALSLQSWSTNYKENLERIINLGIEYKATPYLSLFSSMNKGLINGAKANFEHSLELSLFNILKLRLGVYPEDFLWPIYKINSGLGLTIGNLSCDYAYIGGSTNTLSDTSRVTIGIKL